MRSTLHAFDTPLDCSSFHIRQILNKEKKLPVTGFGCKIRGINLFKVLIKTELKILTTSGIISVQFAGIKNVYASHNGEKTICHCFRKYPGRELNPHDV